MFSLQDHPTTTPALQNGESTTAAITTHSLLPISEASSSIQSAIDSESRSVGNLLSEVYNFERKQQDLMLKLIDALQSVKEELEGVLIQGGGLVGAGELGEVRILWGWRRERIER